MLDINIVIVNYKTKNDLDACLASLLVEIEDLDLKVVVHVMDNSANADGAKDLIEEKYKKVIYMDCGGNIGFGAAQNMGFENKQAKYYIALNPDVEFISGQETLLRIFDFMEKNPQAGIAGPKNLNVDGSIQYSCCRNFGVFDQIIRRLGLDKRNKKFKKRVDYYLMKDFSHEETVPVDWVIGSFMMLRGELFEKIGFFDDRYFMYFEDCDLSRKSWEDGYKVIYIHDIIVRHKHKRDSAEENPFLSIFKNKVARIHLKSWIKYHLKWGLRKKRFGI